MFGRWRANREVRRFGGEIGSNQFGDYLVLKDNYVTNFGGRGLKGIGAPENAVQKIIIVGEVKATRAIIWNRGKDVSKTAIKRNRNMARYDRCIRQEIELKTDEGYAPLAYQILVDVLPPTSLVNDGVTVFTDHDVHGHKVTWFNKALATVDAITVFMPKIIKKMDRVNDVNTGVTIGNTIQPVENNEK